MCWVSHSSGHSILAPASVEAICEARGAGMLR
jgi:hypothetical protein